MTLFKTTSSYLAFFLFFFLLFSFSVADAEHIIPELEVIQPVEEQVYEPGEVIEVSIWTENFIFVSHRNYTRRFPGNHDAGHAVIWVVPATQDTDNLSIADGEKLLSHWATARLPGRSPGDYKVVVELVRNDESRFDPPVRKEVLVHVQEPFNTPEGTDVEVEEGEATITFSEVIQAGDTEIETSSSGTESPNGFRLGDPAVYYNISTTAEFLGSVEVCISYTEEQFITEDNLKFMHLEEGEWRDITTFLDTESNIICGESTSFSEFALMTQDSTEELEGIVKEMQLQKGVEKSLLQKLSASVRVSQKSIKAEIGILRSFIKQVDALQAKKISIEQATELIHYTKGLVHLKLQE